jgi:hypothetical protein
MVKVTRLVAALLGLSIGGTGCLPSGKKSEPARGAPPAAERAESRAPERAPAAESAKPAPVAADDAPGSPGLSRVRVIEKPKSEAAPAPREEEIDPRAFDSRVPPQWQLRAGPNWWARPRPKPPKPEPASKVQE